MTTAQNNLVAWYRMDDSVASTVVLDSSENGYNGTSIRNTADMHVMGVIGGALSFNGVSYYIDTGQTFQSTFQNSFTISLWAFEPSNMIIGNGSSQAGKMLLSAAGEDEIIGVTYQTVTMATVDPTYPVEEWFMLTVVVQKLTSSTIDMLMYVNRNLVLQKGSTSCTMTNFSSIYNPFIGAKNMTGIAEDFFLGSIDDVRIYNKALSANEVKQLYNEGITINNLNSTGEQFLSMIGV